MRRLRVLSASEYAPATRQNDEGRDWNDYAQRTARRILAFLHERVAQLDDPRSIGEALKDSKLGAFWKYRVGDYRIISSIEEGREPQWQQEQGQSAEDRARQLAQHEPLKLALA